MFEGNQYSFDLSMRYSRGHVAVSLTATSMEKAIELGLADFKSNLRIHEFQAAIETFHFDKSSEYDYYTEVSNETVTMPQRKLTTLIVEDDPAASAVLQATLKALGCTVDHFDLPGEALKAMETKRYDLLVLDWNLPYMKGGEFLVAADKQLHKSDRPGQPDRQVPFVICTSLPLEEINLPPVTHFSFFNHWHKSLPFSSILGSVDDTTKKVNVRNSISA
jgi:CheY-like chemotaxis protein